RQETMTVARRVPGERVTTRGHAQERSLHARGGGSSDPASFVSGRFRGPASLAVRVGSGVAVPYNEPVPEASELPASSTTLEAQLMWTRKFRGALIRRPTRPRPSRRVPLVELTGLELLDRRVLPAVTATFSAAGALLRVTGDAQDNIVVVSR